MLGPLWIRRCISAQGHCRAASAVDLSGPREFPPSSRRGARGLRNICVGSSRFQKLQGGRADIRGAPARLQNFRREAAHASKYVHWGLKGFKESQGGCSGGKARERRFFRRLRSVLQNVCGGAGRTFKTSAVGRRELQDICSALFRGFQKSAGRFTGLEIFCCATVKSLGLSGLRENSSSVRFFQGARAPHICGGAARAFKTSGLRELRYICGAFSKDFKRSGRWSGLSVFCEGNRSCGKSRAERASKCLRVVSGRGKIAPRRTA